MKIVVAMTLLSLVTGLANAQESCASKEADILRQLEHAREQGNAGRIGELETALGKVRAHCTDEGLQAERQEGSTKRVRKSANVKPICRRRCVMAIRRRSKSASANWPKPGKRCARY